MAVEPVTEQRFEELKAKHFMRTSKMQDLALVFCATCGLVEAFTFRGETERETAHDYCKHATDEHRRWAEQHG